MRRHEPEVIDVEPTPPPLWRRLLPPVLLLLVLAAGVVVVVSKLRESRPALHLPETEEVRSDIMPHGDSLAVTVEWQLAAAALGMPESVRVEVGLGDGATAQVSTLPGGAHSDTALVPAPEPGKTATGYSCVAAVRQGRLGREKCTPWQYVRPAAGRPADTATTERPKVGTRSTRTGPVRQIVVQPDGAQVDPDIGGRCADWQRRHPGESVWIDINRRAVRECTGPNGKPTVAQFCAFAVLADGRRVKTAASEGVPYCERLFRDWGVERVSAAATAVRSVL